jgi:hypothetical protein
MRVHRVLVFFFVFTSLFVIAQKDSTLYQTGVYLNDGVYLTYYDFRRNKVIPAEDLVSPAQPDQLDFVSRAVENEKMRYRIDGKEYSINSKEIWGYVQNGTFYVNFQGKFYRIPVFGSISFLVATVEVRQAGFYDPRFGGYTGATTTYEQREFIINFYDGRMQELKMEDLEKLFSRDKALYAEYKQLSNRKQKEQVYRFIRKYNENNPVYFLN